MQRWRGMAFVALAVGLLAQAAAAAETTLRIGLAEDADALDPTLARTFVGRIVFASLCDKLFDIGPKLEIVPQLASGYSWSEDKKALTITLRQGVLFHDGERMDAAAVKYSIERHLHFPGTSRKGEIAAVSGVAIVDDHTVRLDLATPFAPLLAQLADRAGMIVSPKAAEAAGDKFAAHPVCAGPFKFTERVAQGRIVLDRFAGYWDKDKIHLDRVIFLPIPDAAVRLADLRSGSLDLIERLSPSDLAEIAKSDALASAATTELGYQSLQLNISKGAGAHRLADPRLREALELSIDRAALNQVAFDGQFEPGNQWVAPENPFYDKSHPVPGRDLARANALVKEMGKPATGIDFMVPNDSQSVLAAQVIQSMAQEAGIFLNIRATEFPTALSLAEKGEFDVFFYAWSGRADPDGNLFSFVSCNGPTNYSGYCNAEVDNAIVAGRTTDDVPLRRERYAFVAAQVLKDRPLIYLYHRRWIYAYTKRLSGFHPIADGLIRPQGLVIQ
jgi:peptide/nickel transport system substrate-binding protein